MGKYWCQILAATLVIAAPGTVSATDAARVFTLQHQQDPADFEAYDSFYLEMRHLIGGLAPAFAGDRPNLVVLGGSTGLLAVATGPRFAGVRAMQSDGSASHPLYGATEPAGVALGMNAALGALSAGYTKEIAFYEAKFPPLASRRALLVAATDTIVRSFYNALQRLAIDLSATQRWTHGQDCNCDVYIVAGGPIAPFEEVEIVTNPAAVAVMDPEIVVNGDPVRQRRGLLSPFAFGQESAAFVATAPEVYDTAFVWGPDGEIGRVRKANAGPLDGPLLLDLSMANVGDAATIALPRSGIRLGIAIGSDAVSWGEPSCLASGDCTTSDLCAGRETRMRCLDARGANLLLALGASPVRWASADEAGRWRPLVSMSGDWRAVSDLAVGFRYAVAPFTVGNVFDVAFDGQSAVWERGRSGAGDHRIGARELVAGDDSALADLAGDKPQAVAIVPWVVADGDTTYTNGRADLMEIARRLAPGSGDDLENGYVEAVLCVDLDVALGGHAEPCPGL